MSFRLQYGAGTPLHITEKIFLFFPYLLTGYFSLTLMAATLPFPWLFSILNSVFKISLSLHGLLSSSLVAVGVVATVKVSTTLRFGEGGFLGITLFKSPRPKVLLSRGKVFSLKDENKLSMYKKTHVSKIIGTSFKVQLIHNYQNFYTGTNIGLKQN